MEKSFLKNDVEFAVFDSTVTKKIQEKTSICCTSCLTYIPGTFCPLGRFILGRFVCAPLVDNKVSSAHLARIIEVMYSSYT